MLRAPRRLRRRFLGPGPHEARLFFTPGLVALATIAVFAVVAAKVLPSLLAGPSDLPYLFASPLHGISLRSGAILLAALLLAFYAVLVAGWLVEAGRFGWHAYRPWRIAGGLWGTILFAASLYLGYTALAAPSAAELVERARADLPTPRWRSALPAIAHGLPGAEEAVRDRLRNDDGSVRFLAATILWGEGDRSPRVARTLLRTIEAVRAVPAPEREEAFSPEWQDRVLGGLGLLVPRSAGKAPLGGLEDGAWFREAWSAVAPEVHGAARR